MRIDFLANHPQHVETVTKWLWLQWGEPYNYLFWKTLVKSCLSTSTLPQAYLAISELGEAIGTACLWRCDLLSRQDLTPWLACLFVDPQYRQMGVGKRLQYHCCQQAKKMGFRMVYLFSELEGYYEAFGWTYLGHTQHELGFKTKLYGKNISKEF